MALTLEEANRMVRAAMAKSVELNVNMSVAVCDTGGTLLAFNRMEAAVPVTATVAQGKAMASAGFGRASGGMDADSANIQSIVKIMGGRMHPHQGAVPIFKDGVLVGAIAGSGSRVAQEDEDVAQAGLDAL